MSKTLQQLDLLPKADAHQEEITPELVRSIKRRPTLLRAWHYAQEVSALEDKEVYTQLDIDASHWTRIKNGSASPPADERFVRFMDVVHNEIPLIWLVENRGYDWFSLRKHRSDTERRLAEVEQENADLKRAFVLAFGRDR